jgi:hypothetical protein
MLKTLLLAGAFLCLSFPASAAECEFPFDDVIGQFADADAPVVIIDPAELAQVVGAIETVLGADYGDVTRGFFAKAGGKILLGLEVDDCLIEPINLGPVPAVSAPLSGKDEAGHIGA